jgi:hypothetical protein
MMISNHVGDCPYCGVHIDNIYGIFSNEKDYSMDFDFNCPKCGEEINCEVREEPVFIFRQTKARKK